MSENACPALGVGGLSILAAPADSPESQSCWTMTRSTPSEVDVMPLDVTTTHFTTCNNHIQEHASLSTSIHVDSSPHNFLRRASFWETSMGVP